MLADEVLQGVGGHLVVDAVRGEDDDLVADAGGVDSADCRAGERCARPVVVLPGNVERDAVRAELLPDGVVVGVELQPLTVPPVRAGVAGPGDDGDGVVRAYADSDGDGVGPLPVCATVGNELSTCF
ncbi:hypothetical protein [Streptomyces cyaneofuscatus]|uniref:hypothetical protein n=1 Tax=Streptomyces cyaneofuscatus TaxID=66883 RepID=UPI002FF09285